MKASDFDYLLPEELVARHPADQREQSRMMVLHRDSTDISHCVFSDLSGFLRKGDLLVLNDTRVFPARLLGVRAPSGGKVEALLLETEGERVWRAMVRPGKRIRQGDRLVFAPGRLEATVEVRNDLDGMERILHFEYDEEWWALLDEVGHTPLPPYILQARKQDAAAVMQNTGKIEIETSRDRERYQTVYAGDERASVAAPTAGLHFSDAVFASLEAMGVECVSLQLHVGAGTFQPIKTDNVEDHPMHEEMICISPQTAQQINCARKEGRRIVAVGTTVTRALETAALVAAGEGADIFRPDDSSGPEDVVFSDNDAICPLVGWTRLMIAPGYQFRAVDSLLTNFHLPRSSLLLLISALAGRRRILEAYQTAIRMKYRFYSYGDCMLIE